MRCGKKESRGERKACGRVAGERADMRRVKRLTCHLNMQISKAIAATTNNKSGGSSSSGGGGGVCFGGGGAGVKVGVDFGRNAKFEPNRIGFGNVMDAALKEG